MRRAAIKRVAVVAALAACAAVDTGSIDVAGAVEGGTRYELLLERGIGGDAKRQGGKGKAEGEEGRQDVRIHLGCSGTRFPQVWGTVGPMHNIPHPLDASGLKLEGPRLRGEVKSSFMRRRLWEHSYALCGRYRIEAVIEGPEIKGAYKGGYGDEAKNPVEGKVSGRIIPVSVLRKTYSLPAEASWPSCRGPYGTGSGVDCGRPMIERFEDLRLIWHSQDWVGGTYAVAVQVGHAGPIVADDKVFVSFWNPGGELYSEDTMEKTLQKMRGVMPSEARKRASVLADDVVVCMDAATGMTLWRQVFPGRAANIHVGPPGNDSKARSQLIPCYSRGKLYTVGCLGHIDCFDASTGEVLWQSKAGLFPELVEHRRRCMEARQQRDASTGTVSPNVIGGVLLHQRGKGGGLIGLDAETGEHLWENKRVNLATGSVPIRWTHQGKEYAIADTTCLDPRTGRALWTIAGAVHRGECSSVHVSGDILVVNGASHNRGLGFQAYRLRPDGTERIWALGDDGGSISISHFKAPVIYRDHFYAYTLDKALGRALICVELRTGKVVNRNVHKTYESGACSSLVQTDGLLIYEGIHLNRISPTKLERLGDSGYRIPWACSVTPAVAGGRLFLRTQDGVACYDLRKPAP